MPNFQRRPHISLPPTLLALTPVCGPTDYWQANNIYVIGLPVHRQQSGSLRALIVFGCMYVRMSACLRSCSLDVFSTIRLQVWRSGERPSLVSQARGRLACGRLATNHAICYRPLVCYPIFDVAHLFSLHSLMQCMEHLVSVTLIMSELEEDMSRMD